MADSGRIDILGLLGFIGVYKFIKDKFDLVLDL